MNFAVIFCVRTYYVLVVIVLKLSSSLTYFLIWILPTILIESYSEKGKEDEKPKEEAPKEDMGEDDDDDVDKDEGSKISRKKLRKMNRLTVAELKQVRPLGIIVTTKKLTRRFNCYQTKIKLVF